MQNKSTHRHLVEQLVQIKLNESLGNLNRLPANYKKLIEYTMREISSGVYSSGVKRPSENSEIEYVEGVPANKALSTLNKASAKAGREVSFFLIANQDGYEIYVPRYAGTKLSKTDTCTLFHQKRIPSYDLEAGPVQPTYAVRMNITKGKPYRIRDLINLDDTSLFNVYVVYADPEVEEKVGARINARTYTDPLNKSWHGRETNLMSNLKDKLPAYKASKIKSLNIENLSISEFIKAYNSAPEEVIGKSMLIDGLGICDVELMSKLRIEEDAVYIARLRTENYKNFDLVLTDNGFELR